MQPIGLSDVRALSASEGFVMVARAVARATWHRAAHIAAISVGCSGGELERATTQTLETPALLIEILASQLPPGTPT